MPALWAIKTVAGLGPQRRLDAIEGLAAVREFVVPPPFEFQRKLVAPPPAGSIKAISRGNLPLSDYRYWQGCEAEASSIGVCRFCKKVTLSSEERRQHSSENPALPCTVKLIRAYELLRIDAKCVICDTHTSKHYWGVPICSRRCVGVWQFGREVPPALDAAITLAKRRGLYGGSAQSL